MCNLFEREVMMAKNVLVVLLFSVMVTGLFVVEGFGKTPTSFDDPPPQRIKFQKGASSAIVKGVIKGYAFKDYVFSARAGQHARVTLTSANTYAVLVIRAKSNPDDNLAVEAVEWDDDLPESGDYLIRVLMMRAGARRPGATANFSLKVEIE
ncbi:MAG: hypothetical protein AB1757_15560 [Acidobacteriota bacterium]